MNPPTLAERLGVVPRMAHALLTIGLVAAVLSGVVPPAVPAAAQQQVPAGPMPTGEPAPSPAESPSPGEDEPTTPVMTIVDEASLASNQPAPVSILAAGDPLWVIETVDDLASAGSFASLAIGDDASLHVSYYEQGSLDLRYALFEGTSWITRTVDYVGDVGQSTSLALDSAGNPRISYKDYSNWIGKLKYARFTGTEWITETVHNFSDDAGSYSSLAIDAADNPHIAYLDVSAFETLGYAYNDGSWHYDTPDSTGRVGGHVSLALVDDLFPRISYYDMVNDALLYAALDGTWTLTEVNNPGEGGKFTSMVLDAANQPHISYYARNTHELRYAYLEGSTWISETVAVVGDSRVHTSLALDTNGQPHIAYYDDLFYNLGYATHDGTNWTTQTVDNSGYVDGYPSLALDAGGNAHIVYHHTAEGLKHAWQQPCTPAEILDVNGPLTMTLGAWSIFTATVSPASASVPLQYVWEPPGLAPISYDAYTTESTIEIPAAIVGTHPLTVTVSGCGGVLETTRELTIIEAPLPDLVVTDLWQDGGSIWYQLANVGAAPAAADHVSLLTVDGVRRSEGGIKVQLAPGETRSSSFPYAYACSENEDSVRLDVDAGERIIEEDEDNNTREESWLCDQVPPEISDVRFDVSTEEATIGWLTDDPSDSAVEYGTAAGQYDGIEYDSRLGTEHRIGLRSLTPSTAYHFRVHSTDANGLQSYSTDFYFETLALPGDPPKPTLVVTQTEGFEDVYTIKADFADTSFVERVEFYLDGKLVDTDYSESDGEYQGILSPYALGMTSTEFYSVEHTLEARTRGLDTGLHISEAILELGHESPDTQVEITFPPPGLTIYYEGDAVPAGKKVDIMVTAAEYDFQCDWIPVSGSRILKPDCEDVQQAVEFVQFIVDNNVVYTSYPSNSSDLWHYYTLDLGGWTGPSRHIVARAIDTTGGKHSAETTINIHKIVREPILDVTRDVTREGTHLRVQLTVENLPEATGEAKVDKIRDNVAGFQIVPKEEPDYRVTASYGYWIGSFARDSFIEIDLGVLPDDTVTLSPGESFTVEYLMVPVLYEEPFDYRIGGLGRGDVRVFYEEPSGQLEWRGYDRRFVFTLQSMVSAAIREADYLLVTHPRNLSGTYGFAGLNPLLGTMAELATLKQGVLAYLESPDPRDMLDALVEPGGGWASRMHPAFSRVGEGYMLIVGETEIVPAWNLDTFDGDKVVSLSDQYYSSIGNGPPNINLGRVIGDSMSELRDVIQTSINVHQGIVGYGFDRSDALLASGVGSLLDIMIQEADYAETTLQNQGLNVTKLHWRDYAFLGGFALAYDKYDGIAVGDVVLGDGTDEIVVASDAANSIQILDRTGALLASFARTIEDGDALAVGDLNSDGNDEIVFGDISSDQIYVYDSSGTELTRFSQDFAPRDQLAVGNVVGGLADEIVMADRDGHIYVFDGAGTTLRDFARAFGPHDALALGDVNGDAADELVLRTETASSGDQITATISSHVAAGVTLSQTASFESINVRDGDALAVGDLDGNGTSEILMGHRNRWLVIKNQQGDSVANSIPTYIVPFDGLIAGRFSGAGWDELLVAAQTDVYYYPDIRFIDQGHNAYRAEAPDQDVLFFIGHGSPDSWGPGLANYWLPAYFSSSPHFPLNFGNSNPVVYGATCQSGNYERGDDDNIAEAFLASGAAVFIGAVENSGVGPTEAMLEWFLDNWEDGETIGKAWFDMERAKWQSIKHDGDGWDFALHEYNLYGDPKFGAQPAVPDARAVALSEAQVPPAGFEVEVPYYELEAGEDGYDQVTIPGGQLVVEVGEYQVPYWTHTIEIARGYRIQDVTLARRSESIPITGLNLPVTPDEIWSQVAGSAAEADPPVLDPDDSWIPALDQEYSWQVIDNADGTTTLVVRVYPFYFQPLTGNGRFHQKYAFEVNSIDTTVAVEELTISQAAYPQGDGVPIELIVENTGEPQDVLIDATIRRNQGGELVQGLLLRTLHGVSGLASFSLEWDSVGAPPGDYYVEVRLYDNASNLLDQDTQSFRLGILAGEIASLEATPELFTVGDTIDISMVFENVGTLPINGTAVIEVQTADGLAVTGSFTQTVVGLAPGNSIELNEAWDTSGVALGDYRVIGYILYDSRSTGVSTVALTNLRRVYLPAVLRGY